MQNMDKELAIIKVQNLKWQVDDKHLVAKNIEVDKAIKKVEA
jgi:hypothetical protein